MNSAKRVENWVRILEDLVRIPFTNIRFGLDVILGLAPIVGDFAGALCGLPLLVAGLRRRLPLRVLLMMTVNVLLDAVMGSLPVLGDLFDIAWKSHRKNLQLLQDPSSLSQVLGEAKMKMGALIGIVGLLLVALAGLLVFAVWAWISLLEWSWGVV
jgi:hypothetical protein